MSRPSPANGCGPARISISRIKQEMHDVSYLSDDLVISALEPSAPALQHPLLVEGFAAVVMVQGRATVAVNGTRYAIRPNDLVVIRPGAATELVSSTKQAAAYMIAFSESFIADLRIDLAAAMPVYMRFGRNPVLPVTGRDVEEIRQVFQLVRTMLRSDKERYRAEIIRSLFTTAFYIITDLDRREPSDGPGKPRRLRSEVIFEEFSRLLQQHGCQERAVAFYAGRMGMTPKYLAATVKTVSGKTAAAWIADAVMLEAKRLLQYSSLSIQEIAYHLNFASQSFFGKYFKQHTGFSPSRYRRHL